MVFDVVLYGRQSKTEIFAECLTDMSVSAENSRLIDHIMAYRPSVCHGFLCFKLYGLFRSEKPAL